MIVLDAIFPVVTATIAGIAGVDRASDLVGAQHGRERARARSGRSCCPPRPPQIMTGLQVALPIALIVAVVAEMLMGGYGLGGAMVHASRFRRSRAACSPASSKSRWSATSSIKAMTLVRRPALLIWHQGGVGAEAQV